MKVPTANFPLAIRFYSLILRLYPALYKQAFARQMLQTFKDQYKEYKECREASHDGLEGLQVGIVFWFGVVSDELKGIAREQISAVWRRQWLLFGIIISLLLIPLALQVGLTIYVGLPDNVVNVLGAVSTFGPLLVIILAGFSGTMKTGNVLRGIQVGLLASFVGTAIAIGVVAPLMWLFWDAAVSNALHDPGMLLDFQRSSAPTFADFVRDDSLRAAVILITTSVFGGLLMSAAGSLLWRIWPRARRQKNG